MAAVTDVVATAEPRFQADAAERVGDDGLRLGQLQPDLRTPVDAPADLDDVGEDRLGGGQECGESVVIGPASVLAARARRIWSACSWEWSA